MLVYGDHSEQADPRARLIAIGRTLSAPRLSHDELTAQFIALSGVIQGIADADFALSGMDRHRPAEALLLSQLTGLGARLLESWDNGRSGAAGMCLDIPGDLPDQIEIRLPEGYAFYALYPEAYGLAARHLRLSAAPRIIGLRSIGTGLACIAAAALDAPAPVTLRPTGDPFARTLRIAPDFEQALLRGDAHFIVVDEGPGLSGSSLGTVADWLEDRGVSADRIAVLPGHSNPLGPSASERHRSRWSKAQRPVVALDTPSVESIEPLTGRLTRPLQDISGGAWRPLWSAGETDWPAINPTWERRKFLAQTNGGQWLVKFAGLGSIGEQKLTLAHNLYDAGFGAEVAGLAHGWLVTRWHADAISTRPTLAELTGYLRFRRTLPAAQPGATPEELLTMVRRNVPALRHWSPAIARLSPAAICTDNRMAAHEWLRLPSGRLIKADALDHHAAHDLIGCQDIAWDVAGAIVELDLGEADSAELAAALRIARALLEFYKVAYRAFRIGAHRMTAASLDHWPEEQRRNIAAAERFEAQLASVDAVQHAGDVH